VKISDILSYLKKVHWRSVCVRLARMSLDGTVILTAALYRLTLTAYGLAMATFRLTMAADELGFGIALCFCFAVSLTPFLLDPSVPLTILLSLPPFLLIAFYARARWRKVESQIQAECSCLDAFIPAAESLWLRIRTVRTATISEVDVIGLVPGDIRRPAVYAKALIEDIAKGKLYLIDAPQDAVLRPYRDELETRYRGLGSFSGLSVKVGILGTFFGFILALSNLSLMFAPGQPHPELLTHTLQNLSYSFVKSLYGLAFSILIAIRVSGVRHSLEHFYRRFDEALRFGREFVSRMTLADPSIHTSLMQVRSSLKQLDQRLLNHADTVAKALQQHGALINEQTTIFASAAMGMTEVQKNWDAAFTNLSKAAKGFNEATVQAMADIGTRLGNAGAKVEAIAQSLGATREDFANERRKLFDALDRSETGWSGRFGKIISESERWATVANNAFTALRDRMSIIEGNIREQQANAGEAAKARRDLAEAIASLTTEVRQRHFAEPGRRPVAYIFFIAIMSSAIITTALAMLASPERWRDLLGQIWKILHIP
jgi:hypothetical protein